MAKILIPLLLIPILAAAQPNRDDDYLLLLIPVLAATQGKNTEEFLDGRASWYIQNPVVACDIPQNFWPPYTAALDEVHFKGGLTCGTTAHLKWRRNDDSIREIEIMIVDLCSTLNNEQWCSGDKVHFDLGGRSTFAQLDDPDIGILDGLGFKWIATPVGNSPVKLRFMDGMNQWWVAIQVLNHRYPIAKLELRENGSTQWVAGDRTQPGLYNYWIFTFSGNGLQPPFYLRLTDENGQVIQETGNTVQENYIWDGQNQFPLLSE